MFNVIYKKYSVTQRKKLLKDHRTIISPRSPGKRKVGCSNPSCDRPKSLKQVVTDPMPNARHWVSVSRVLGGAPCHSRWGTLKNPHCPMAMSAEHRSKFAALYRQWWRLRMSDKFLSRTKNSKQTNNFNQYWLKHYWETTKFVDCFYDWPRLCKGRE